MDELLGLIVLIGVGIISSHLKAKKAQQKSSRKMNGFEEAVESMREGKRNVNREVLAQFMPELLEEEEEIMPASPSKPAAPAQPTTKHAEPLVKASRPEKAIIQAAPPANPAGPILKKARQAPFVQMVPNPQPVLFMDHDEPEGTISTQGESAEEHARHRQKILAEEEAIRMEHEALQEIRHMNLQKLRTAVVMSEILDKPVSLRRRRTF